MPQKHEQQHKDTGWQLSPALLFFGGSAVTLAGALLCGTAYLASTRKALVEEGIDLQARTRAVPLAARALLLSTTGCVALGGLSWVAFQWAGGATSAATVQLGTARQAALLLAQQREAVAAEFRKALKGASEDSTAAVQKGHD